MYKENVMEKKKKLDFSKVGVRFHQSFFSAPWIAIFFGANSGEIFGNVTLKRPFSMVALISSALCKQ